MNKMSKMHCMFAWYHVCLQSLYVDGQGQYGVDISNIVENNSYIFLIRMHRLDVVSMVSRTLLQQDPPVVNSLC